MTKRLSIGLRLTLSYLMIFAVAQLVFGLGMWFILHHNLYDIADDTVEGQIDDVRHFLEAQNKDASAAELQKAVNETYVLEHTGDYLQIQDDQGQWIYRSASLKQHDLPAADANQLKTPKYEDRRLGDQSIRFLDTSIEVNGRRFVIQTGVPEDDILGTLNLIQTFSFDIWRSDAAGWFGCRLLAKQEGPCSRGCADPNRAQHLRNKSRQ